MEKVCKNCGIANEPIGEYCIGCGQKLNEEKVETKEYPIKIDDVKDYKSWRKWVLVIIGLVVISFIMIIPTTLTIPYQRIETYQEQYIEPEYYDVQVPYNNNEFYYESEPYVDTKYTSKQLIYSIQNTICTQRIPFVSGAKVSYIVKNYDSEGGWFNIWIGFYLPDGNKIGKETNKYIYPSTTETFTYTSDSEISSCPYNILSIPTKTITETFTNYRSVQKSRTVVVYKTEKQLRYVTKTRPAQRYVTDYKQQTVMMFQKILGWY